MYLAKQWRMAQVFGPCHLNRRQRWSFWFLASVWFSPSHRGHLENQWMEDFFLCVSIFVIQVNKINLKKRYHFGYLQSISECLGQALTLHPTPAFQLMQSPEAKARDGSSSWVPVNHGAEQGWVLGFCFGLAWPWLLLACEECEPAHGSYVCAWLPLAPYVRVTRLHTWVWLDSRFLLTCRRGNCNGSVIGGRAGCLFYPCGSPGFFLLRVWPSSDHGSYLVSEAADEGSPSVSSINK